jgi:hypothetical protein
MEICALMADDCQNMRENVLWVAAALVARMGAWIVADRASHDANLRSKNISVAERRGGRHIYRL